MFRLKIFSVGKNKETWLEQALDEYVKRLMPYMTVEFIWAKSDEQLIAYVEKESLVIALDPLGKPFGSEQFANFFLHKLQEGGSRLAFVIGGAEGLPPVIKKQCFLISLSQMTFTHQITRLVLVEQIYRAIEISKGTEYHK
jgi:23S rRNA (pseudouridine1915-N3)-methyltransferase